MKQYFCVGSYLPFDSINKSPLNNSKAKQTFSFGKSKRFLQNHANCKIVSYTSNEFKLRKQGASIGSSKRPPMVKVNDYPSPGKYNIKTEIQEANNHIYFALGRENVKANDYLNIESQKYPPSTKYEVSNKFKRLYKNAPVYSMKKRYLTEFIDDPSPGPARYNTFQGKNQDLSLTKYKSVSFSTGKSKRFLNQQTDPPGPGAYKTYDGKIMCLGGGSSRYHSSLAIKFSHAKRKSYIQEQVYRRSSLPGPGNYRSPSQFGQYDGNIYQGFELSGNKFKELRPDTPINIPSNSKKINRPSTSKH